MFCSQFQNPNAVSYQVDLPADIYISASVGFNIDDPLLSQFIISRTDAAMQTQMVPWSMLKMLVLTARQAGAQA